MAFAVEQHLEHGFFWREDGYEYPLLWGVLTLAILLKGSGSLSIDKKFR